MSTPPQLINAQNLHLAPPAKKCTSKRQTSNPISNNNQLNNSTKPFTFGQNTTNNLVNLFSTSSSSSGANATNNSTNSQSNNSNTSKASYQKTFKNNFILKIFFK
jgi:hypothetical protein